VQSFKINFYDNVRVANRCGGCHSVAGGQTPLFARSDEIERAWALIDPVMAEAQRGTAGTMPTYPRGSWGPGGSAALLAADGRAWRAGCGHPGSE